MEDKKIGDSPKDDEITDALTSYLKEISNIPILSAKEEKELGERIVKGDKEALKKLVKHNLKFVVSIAKKYKNLGVSLLDLINEGNLGLIKAAKKFDPDKDIKFLSYASWWVKQSIVKFLIEQSTPIKIPIKAKSRNQKIENIKNKYKKQHSEFPKEKEIMELSGLSQKELKNSEFSRLSFDSLDQFIGEDKDATLMDLIELEEESVEDKHIKKTLIEDVNKYLDTLSEREKDIIMLRYGLYDGKAHTLREIGEKYNISKERVRQLENNIIAKLKRHLKDYR